ncbi:MAG: acyltransferase, partial [Acidobacteria bacterium]|nr:acyltransferase [Acidobacteriota bacterium]
MNSDHIRVASLQYFIRPVRSFDQFREQVEALVDTAEDYRCKLIVFPEYFSAQLLTLGDIRRPMQEQIRDLASQAPRVCELMAQLAKDYKIHIVAGTVPTMDKGDEERVYNESFFFAPNGNFGVQGKMHMTRFEKEEWIISPRSKLRLFETEFGLVTIAICYDCEFPEIVRAAARAGSHLLVVPSCTDDRQGYLRVRYCAQARAI